MNQYNLIRRSFLLFTLFAATVAFGFGQTFDKVSGKQIDRLFSKYNAGTPGVAVAVVRNGKIVFKNGYGAANLEHNVPMTSRTVFNVASVSKQFTAFTVYLLEKQGKISLEDDVRRYVAELPDFGKIVRIKHLLAHTSGVRDQWSLLTLAGWRMDDVITTPQILRLIGRQKELNFEPGTEYLYSNSGYTLLAEIVKRVSGQSFAEYAKTNIFAPLKMNDSQIYDDYERVVKDRADSYELQNGTYRRLALNMSADGATNLYTTVEDLAKWALNFENPKVGDAEMIRRFDEPSQLNNGEKTVYAVVDGVPGYHAKGQIQWNYRGVKRISHGGHQAGFRSSLWRFPEQRVIIIALSNDEHFQQVEDLATMAELYLPQLKPKQKVNSTASADKSNERSNVDLKDYEGRFYNAELDAAYAFKIIGGKPFISHLRHGDIELTSAGRDEFTGRIEFPVQIAFVRDENGEITGLRISNFGAKNVKFDKVK